MESTGFLSLDQWAAFKVGQKKRRSLKQQQRDVIDRMTRRIGTFGDRCKFVTDFEAKRLDEIKARYEWDVMRFMREEDDKPWDSRALDKARAILAGTDDDAANEPSRPVAASG